MKKTNLVLIKETAEELLSLMGTKGSVDVSEDKENSQFSVEINTLEEAGLLIGRHGDTLNSIQAILSLILRQKTNDWVRIVVNVGDWRERQEEYLKNLAKEAALRAKETNEAQTLYNLTPYQRRIVHLELSTDADIETESQGEEEERYLVVKPKGK